MKVVKKSIYKSETKLIKYLSNHYYIIVFRDQRLKRTCYQRNTAASLLKSHNHLYKCYCNTFSKVSNTRWYRKEPLSIIYYQLPHLIEACALAVGLWEYRCKSAASPISTGPFKLIHGHSSILNYEKQRNWKVDLYAWFLGFTPLYGLVSSSPNPKLSCQKYQCPPWFWFWLSII